METDSLLSPPSTHDVSQKPTYGFVAKLKERSNAIAIGKKTGKYIISKSDNTEKVFVFIGYIENKHTGHFCMVTKIQYKYRTD